MDLWTTLQWVLKIEVCPQWAEGTCVRMIHPAWWEELVPSASGWAHCSWRILSNLPEGAMNWGCGHPAAHANFAEQPWTMSSLGPEIPLWKREGPPRVAGNHCKWFKVGLILTHGQKSSHCSLPFRPSPLHKGANLSFGASLSLSLWNTCQTASWTKRTGLRFTAYRTRNI